MRRVILGFENAKFQKTLVKAFRNNGDLDIEFVKKTSKASVVEALSDLKPDAVILMEECGSERWSMDELLQIKDSHHVQIIPIISDEYYGSSELSAFCNYGMTSAILVGKAGKLRSDDIVYLVNHPRSLKDARSYYGVQTMQDAKNYNADVLDGYGFERARSALYDEQFGESIGPRFKKVVMDMSPSQVADFIKKLDDDVLQQLQKTFDYYDVLEILKKAGVIRRYRIPRDIKKAMKQKVEVYRETPYEQEEAGREVSLGEKIFDASYQEEILDDEDDEDDMFLSSGLETDGFVEIEFAEDFGETFGTDMGEDCESDEESEEDISETEEENYNFSEDDWGEGDLDLRNDNLEQGETVSEDFFKSQENTCVEEDNAEEFAEKKILGLDYWIFGVLCVSAAVFVVVMVASFMKIYEKQQLAKRANLGDSAYDVQYDSAEYERTDVPEEMPAGDVGEGGESLEEIELTLTSEEKVENPNADAIASIEDTDMYEDGLRIKGLDLVNKLNSTEGADCIVVLKNGTEVLVMAGQASFEDIAPSAYYKCDKKDGSLKFKQE